MRLDDSRESNNVEDRRGQEPLQSGMPSQGQSGLLMLALRFLPYLIRTKVGRTLLCVGGLFWVYQQFMSNPNVTTDPVRSTSTASASSSQDLQSDPNAIFASKVLATTEDIWSKLLQGQYTPPKMVLYSQMTTTACGQGNAQAGPFYCPGDQKVYLDLNFIHELKKLGAPGDFAFAYVIAHEVGHHVQNLMGTSAKVQSQQAQLTRAQANQLSVKLELQADCYAGVWGHYADSDLNILDAGDIDEGIQAASAVGDDTLMKNAGRDVQVEAFTHGSSKQRIQWFKTGFESGKVESCNTFAL